jgi:hypothetical protein
MGLEPNFTNVFLAFELSPLLSVVADLEIGKCTDGIFMEIYNNKNLDLLKTSQKYFFGRLLRIPVMANSCSGDGEHL